MKYIATVLIEVEIDDHFIDEGFNEGDMVENEIGNALNGSGLEWEMGVVKRGELNG